MYPRNKLRGIIAPSRSPIILNIQEKLILYSGKLDYPAPGDKLVELAPDEFLPVLTQHGNWLRVALFDHCPGKVQMLTCVITVLPPPEIKFLDVGRA